MPVAEEIAQRQGFEPWFNTEGKVIGWQTQDSSPFSLRRPIIIFHGNAGYALHRTNYQSYLGNEWQVKILEYPGFGVREGRPSEEVLVAAAAEAVVDLIRRGHEDIFLLGESLGTGVAAAVAARFPKAVRGMVFVTPFTSLADVAASQFPFLPVRTVLRDRYESSVNLRSYGGPLFVLIAGQDEVVPKELGIQLYNDFEGPKELIVLETATHNTILSASTRDIWNDIVQFLIDQQDFSE